MALILSGVFVTKVIPNAKDYVILALYYPSLYYESLLSTIFNDFMMKTSILINYLASP